MGCGSGWPSAVRFVASTAIFYKECWRTVALALLTVRNRTQGLLQGWECPRCHVLAKDVPSDCEVCSLKLLSSSHLARSYHHLFPVSPFRDKARLSNRIFHCHPASPCNRVTGKIGGRSWKIRNNTVVHVADYCLMEKTLSLAGTSTIRF